MVFGRYKDAANSVFWRRRAGPTADQNEFTYTFPSAITSWFCMGFSWDINIPQLRGYVYAPGVVGWTKVFDAAGTNMDTMATRDWSDFNNTLLGAGGVNSQLWQGWIGPIAQWAGVTLSDAEMQRAMTG
jgi:hypothetical protein